MTIGIYALYWENEGLVYIGQGNIEVRFKAHNKSMKLGTHYNYKVQNTFNSHGIPKLVVLETNCENINISEQKWITEFNSTRDGLNILPGGEQLSGLNHPRSVYTKFSILKVFSLLYSTNNTYSSISIRTNVNANIVADISQGKIHNWLQDAYPELYNNMQLNRQIRRCRKGYRDIIYTYPSIIDSEGVVYTITNIAKFCREHPKFKDNWELEKTSIGKVLRGIRPSHKGFRLVK